VGCDLAAYNSDWAADSAVSLYGLNRSNVAVVPFGSNFAVSLSSDAIASLVQRRVNDERVKLLFVGTQWERKGGDFAMAVTDSLVRRGVDALISIIGSVPPREASYVKTYGFVSKATTEGAGTLERCYREAHFLVHPAVAECNANVFSEACSFGLPIIANRTGGIPTSVIPGKNGTLFDLGDSPDSWADWIINTLRDRAVYAALSMGAHRQFNEKLHWPVAAGTMLRLMEALLTRSRTQSSSVAAGAAHAGPFVRALG
jgi:glycosyltransferase involved in cell wall biosynthesis